MIESAARGGSASLEWLRYGVLLGIAALVIVADQISKAIVVATLSHGRVVELLGGLIRLDYTVNTGAAFGVLRTGGTLFIVVAAVVSVAIIVSYRRIVASAWPVRVALGLVLGGALGNLIDRLRLGYVVDFIDLRWWPVFNLADSAIVVGVLILAVMAVSMPGTSRE